MKAKDKIAANILDRRNATVKTRRPGLSPSVDSPSGRILHLQQTIGNHAVQKLIGSVLLRGKITVGESDDAYEHEADRVADHVMGTPEPSTRTSPTRFVTRAPSGGQGEGSRSKGAFGNTSETTSDAQSRIQDIRGGHPLDPATHAYFEPRFGYAFHNVRIHTDSTAAEAAKAFHAKAFTLGPDIVFGSGQFSPDSFEGKRLLAHELTHVIQQRSEGSPLSSTVQRKLEMEGRKAEDFIAFLLRATGRRYVLDGSTHLVGLPLRDPFEKPLEKAEASVAVEKLNEVIRDPDHTARILIDVQGGFPQTVVLGQFIPEAGAQQFLDFDHIDGLERAVPGAGLAIALHEIYERYRFERIPADRKPGPKAKHPAGPAHEAALLLEPRILKQYGLSPGPRMSEDLEFTGPAGRQKLLFTIRYRKLDLVIVFRTDMSKTPMQVYFDSAEVRHH